MGCHLVLLGKMGFGGMVVDVFQSVGEDHLFFIGFVLLALNK